MAQSTIQEQLVKYLTDAHALEQHVSRQLDAMISTTDDPEMREHLEHHKEETERHRELLEERLRAHDAEPSTIKDTANIFAALGKSMLDVARPDNAGKNARDGFVAEHLEIASYELLERVATRAGDEETAEVARTNRAEEERMVKIYEQNWDRFAELSLEEVGATA